MILTPLIMLLALIGAGILPGQEPPLDYKITGGLVYDGSLEEARLADVGIRGDRIIAIGDLGGVAAQKTIDATCKVVCPGFIDLHNHSDSSILLKGRRQNLSYVTQGCTTIVTGNCGGGQIGVATYLAKLQKWGAGTNVAHLLPQGSIRGKAMGGSFDRPPTEAELEKMRSLVASGMEAGAFGMSTGLIYPPGAYASTEEITALAKVVGRFGGIYASHMRSEAGRLLEAITETISIGEGGGCPVHISHFKVCLPPNWGRIGDAAKMIEAAQKRGVRVTCDQYPYRASSTSLAALVIPTWAREGRQADLVKRLDDPKAGPKIRAAIAASFERRGGADKILIAHYRAKEAWNGKTVLAVATEMDLEPAEAVMQIQRQGGASAVAFSMCDEDVESAMKLPYVATASDGSSKMPDKTRPHPRSYGTFPRKIGLYAIEKKVISLGRAIHSCSGQPAEILGLSDRGLVREGFFADLVVFDPETIRDTATYTDPHRYAVGIEWVWVNGVPTLAESKPTRAVPGRPLRKGR